MSTHVLRVARISHVLVTFLILGACSGSPAVSSTSQIQPTDPTRAGSKARALTVLMNDEPKRLGPIGPGGGSLQASSTTPLLWESFLGVLDDRGELIPRLATRIPTTEAGDWRVLPNGEMETTWVLKPDLTWHDGTPFTASDVVFTWEVWRDPQVQVQRDALSEYVYAAEALDDHTVLLRWSSPYAFISQVALHSLVPRHILEASWQGDKDQFNNHRWNTVEYVGLGPYRLKEWSPGSSLTLEAFDRYALGQPRIQTIIARFVTDPNVLATVLLAGQADMNIPYGATADSVSLVRARWKETGEGTVHIYPGPSLRFFTYQSRDEFQKLPALKQPPIRQALLYAIDKEALADLLYQDQSLLADSWYVVGDPRRAAFADVITSYPFDARRATTILEQQGWRPGPSGVLTNGQGERFETSLQGTAESGQAVAALSAYWRQVGMAVDEDILSPAQTQDRETRAKLPGLEYTANVPIRGFLNGRTLISQIPGPENRWTGSNRNGLTVPEVDALMRRFESTIEATERTGLEREMMRVLTAGAHFGFLFMYPHQWMVRNTVSGVVPSKVASAVDDWPRVTWNVHEWSLQ